MTDDPRTCTHPGCDRPSYGGLCPGHAARKYAGSSRTGPIQTAKVVSDEPHMACPDGLLPLADWCADLDAKAIVRAIWPHLLEASLAGLAPFTLEAAS